MLLAFTLAIGNVWAADVATTFDFANGSTDGLTITKSGTVANISYSVTNSTYNQIPTLSDGNYFLGMKFTSNSQGVLDVITTNSFTNIKSISFDCAADNNSNPKIAVYIIDDKDAETAVQDAMVMSSGSTKVWRSKKSGVGVYTIDLSSSPKTGKVYFKFTTGSSGKSGAIDNIVITTESAAPGGDPVDPEFTYTPATYTIGDPALDLSTKVTSTNTTGAITFAVSTADAGTTGASIADDKNFTATKAGIAKITVSQAASTGYNAKSQDIEVSVVAPAPAACPAELTISGTKDYTAGQTISLEAALEAGNGEITYTWYKGVDLATAKAAGSIGTGTSFSKASCTTGDAGNYFCVASKDACPDAESAAYAVTVAEKTCPTSGVLYSAVVAATSNQSIAASTSDLALTASQAIVVSGTMSVYNGQSSAKNLISQQNSKYYFTETNGNTFFRVRMDCALQAGDVITAEIYAGGSDTRGLWFATGTTYPSSAPTAQAQRTGPGKIEYVVAVGDGIIGEQDFSIFRATGNSTYFNNFVITRPYNVTFVSDHGTAPTTPTKALSFTLTELSDASFTHTGWTADKAVKVGGETKAASTALAVDATVELTDNTTFTATWEAKAATFAVTYKANNGTEEADINDPAASTFAANTFTIPDGKMFAGWNTKADGEGTNYAVGDAVTEDIVVYAKWVVDPTIRLILKSGDTYSINTDKFTVYEGTELQNEEYTVDGRAFAKNFKFGGNCSSTPFAGQAWSNKFMAYDVTSNSTDIKLYIYNKNTSNKKLYYQIVPEGSAAAAFQSVTITSKATNQVVSIPTITAAKGARVLFGVESTDVRICQIEVLENGTALPAFGTNGYEFSVPGRAATNNKTGAFDGFEFKTNADLKFISGQDYIALRNIDGSQYVKFTVATNIQLQVTTPNANKFYVSKTASGDAEKDTQYGGSAAAHNVNLHAGTYYIAPTVGSSGGEVQITKLAFATAPAVKTVTFDSDGGSSVEAQEVFAGEKAVEPTTPTKDGYRFIEWQLNGSAYDFDETVTADITLDAVWQETVTITFDPNNTEATFTRTADKGTKIATGDIPANPTYAGYDFQGWTTDLTAEPIVHVDLSLTTFSEATTLKAHWEVAQDDATLSALSYNGNAINVASAEDVSGVQTYTVHLPWGSTIDPALVSVTQNAEAATVSSLVYDSENKRISFAVESGNHTVTINYAIQFVIDAKRGTSIVKAVVSGGDQKAGFAATGIYGDKGYAYTRDNKKLDTADKFVGVKLISGRTFATGDKLFVVTSTDADMGYIEIYEEAEGTNLIKATGVRDASEGIEVPELAGFSEFYIVRKASTGDQAWNGFVDYVEVTREMNPAIKSFTIDEAEATIDESAKTISIEVPYATDVTTLTPTVEAYGNNGATYTPAGATDFTNPVVYTVTDGYNEFHTDYTVTVSKAAPSTNAYLASLSVAGYTLDFNKEVEEYNIVLDYGTTVLPEITYAVEDAGLATAVKVENGVNGATTITVTPQAGAGYEKVYSINFSVSTTPKFVIYDGSTMNDYAESGSDVSTGFAWTVVGGNHSAKNAPTTLNGKTYQTAQNIFTSPTKGPDAGNTRYIEITIPDGYLAKFYLAGATNSEEAVRSSYISKEKIGTLDQSIAYASTDLYAGVAMKSGFQLPGTYYYCADASIRLYELSVQLYPIDYSRATTEGRYGTICLPNGGIMVGAELYEVAYYDGTYEKIFLDEVLNGEMVAGRPYIFLTKEGVNQIAVYYTDEENAPEGNYHGLFGSYTRINLAADDHIYILKDNRYYFVDTDNVYCGANRAYFMMGVADGISGSYVAPAPGRRRTSIGAGAPAVATGVEDVQGDEVPRCSSTATSISFAARRCTTLRDSW